MKVHWSVWGCVLPSGGLLLLLLLLTLGLWYFQPGERKPEYIRDAEKKVELKIDELKKRSDDPAHINDLDSTVSALYSMEQAMIHAKTFEDLTEKYVLQESSDMVSADVQALKYKFFNIYKDLLREKDALSEQESLYKVATDSLFELFSVVDPFAMNMDRGQAQKLLDARMERSKLKREYKDRLHAVQGKLLDFMFEYMDVSAKHYREWDKLCSVRDRAYLAVFEGNWDEAILNASEAVEMAPYENEAHVLLAMALLERSGEMDLKRAVPLIEEFRRKQPQNAAGFLVRGVAKMKENNLDEAVVDFDQAAAYFPKLQENVNNRLGIYRKRAYLNKSKEGRVIVNAYRAMMSGSGYFSPDFQKARIHLIRDEKVKAKDKIFDHFFRRRQQGEWDKVLDDFKFSSKALDTDLFTITAAGADIRIKLDEAFFFNRVILKITNNGTAPLTNLTVLLCVRFTDMFKNDYISFPIGETVSILKPGESVEVGRKDISQITEDIFGTKKKFKDIIEYAAVIISDDAITWIDSRMPGEIIQEQEDTENKSAADNTSESVKKMVDDISGKAAEVAVDILNKTVEKTAEKISSSVSGSQNQKPAEGDPKK